MCSDKTQLQSTIARGMGHTIPQHLTTRTKQTNKQTNTSYPELSLRFEA